ncbi:MAG: IPT/TIG domain-containing protein [Chitinophaga sp.]|uniref:IPT/TIG domain-containing protein n=1 Tax=Chitinophaga sp. TaxID=1869181 RepID=UPI001B0BC654|nr:IPT/TIG domain-containing protein [Chitinophaga sp.]MBO9732855.1 IPT/TIG domain-containing protein [Chitinophaga sp.]
MKTILYRLQILLLIVVAAACKKDKGFEHDNNAPVIVDKFTPESGPAGTEVLIYGSNFTTDTAAVSVTVNGVKALVEGVIGDHILVVIPEKAGSGKITVTINGKTTTTAKDFGYITSYKVSTLAGNGAAGFSDGKGIFSSFNFNRRCGLDVDDAGNVYVADAGNFRVRKIAPDGTVTSLAGNGNWGYMEGKGETAQFSLPLDVAVDKDGTVIVADPADWTIRRVTADGTTSLIAWGEAWGIGIDKRNGNIYYANARGSGSIFQVTPSGTATEIIKNLVYPVDVAVDDKGNLYVSENGTSMIKKFAADTWEQTVIAGAAYQTGLVNGKGADARFDYPWAVALDANNNLFVAGNGTGDGSSNNTNQCIRKITANTWDVTTYIGGSTAGFADGAGSAALFNAPTGVAVGKNGVVYVLDRNNNRIRKVIAE